MNAATEPFLTEIRTNLFHFEKTHIPSPLPQNTEIERLLFTSMVARFASRGGYSDIPQVSLIRPALTGPFTHSE